MSNQYVITQNSYGGAYVFGFQNGQLEVGSDHRHDLDRAWTFTTRKEAEAWAKSNGLDVGPYGDFTIEEVGANNPVPALITPDGPCFGLGPDRHHQAIEAGIDDPTQLQDVMITAESARLVEAGDPDAYEIIEP